MKGVSGLSVHFYYCSQNKYPCGVASHQLQRVNLNGDYAELHASTHSKLLTLVDPFLPPVSNHLEVKFPPETIVHISGVHCPIFMRVVVFDAEFYPSLVAARYRILFHRLIMAEKPVVPVINIKALFIKCCNELSMRLRNQDFVGLYFVICSGHR